MTRSFSILCTVVLATACLGPPIPTLRAEQVQPSAEQHLAALKQNLAESQKRIRQYEWIETTVISLKGEEKARKQQRAYYGADGKLQKVPIGDQPQPEPQQGGGRRGGRLKQRIVENKKDEMQEYMERAVELVHRYVPPSAVQVQNAKDAGRMALKPLAQGRARLEFTDYQFKGDRLGIDIDGAANQVLALDVASYLDMPEDTVTLGVRMGTLDDGTGFAAQTTLAAAAKHISVVITNSGHRPLAR